MALQEEIDSYLPTSTESKKARVYNLILQEVELPYTKMLLELATGKTEGKELSYEDVLAYESKIDDLKKKITEEVEPKAKEYKDTMKYLSELEGLMDTALAQVYGARLILTKVQLSISTRPEAKKEARKALDEQIKKQEDALGKVRELLQKYQV